MKIVENPHMILFWRREDFLSQWHPAAFRNRAGYCFSCAEQYMMWRKAVLFEDQAVARRILQTENPVEQKRLGRQIRGFQDVVWNALIGKK